RLHVGGEARERRAEEQADRDHAAHRQEHDGAEEERGGGDLDGGVPATGPRARVGAALRVLGGAVQREGGDAHGREDRGAHDGRDGAPRDRGNAHDDGAEDEHEFVRHGFVGQGGGVGAAAGGGRDRGVDGEQPAGPAQRGRVRGGEADEQAGREDDGGGRVRQQRPGQTQEGGRVRDAQDEEDG